MGQIQYPPVEREVHQMPNPTEEQRAKHAKVAQLEGTKHGLTAGAIAGVVTFAATTFIKSPKWSPAFSTRYRFWSTVMAFCGVFALRFEQVVIDITRNPPWLQHPTEPFRLIDYEKKENHNISKE